MLQVNFLRDNKERVLEGLQKRNFKNPELVDEAIALDEERRKIQVELDNLNAEKNKISKEIGILMRLGLPVIFVKMLVPLKIASLI